MIKCEHGVYDPHGDGAYCQLCNPNGNPERDAAPQFNRRSSLNITETGRLPHCPKCNGLLALSNGGKCSVCKEEYEIESPKNLRANNRQAGLCPDCASGVHYEIDSKTWGCADCGTQYKAPKRLE